MYDTNRYTFSGTGAGNRATTAIDDFLLLTLQVELWFQQSQQRQHPIGFVTTVGTPSLSQNVVVSGNNLTDNITVAAPSPYEVSLDNSSFTSFLYSIKGGTVSNTTRYVRISSSATPGQKMVHYHSRYN